MSTAQPMNADVTQETIESAATTTMTTTEGAAEAIKADMTTETPTTTSDIQLIEATTTIAITVATTTAMATATTTSTTATKTEATTNLIDQQVESEGPRMSARRQTRGKQRRRNRYQTQDLLREVSPQPGQLQTQIMKSVDAQENFSSGQRVNENGLKDGDERGSDNLVEKIDATEEQSKAAIAILNGKRTVQCNICKRQMTESRLANHIRLLHVESAQKNDENSSTKRKEFHCDYCGKSYAIKYTFEQHVRTHTEGRPKCPECGSTFASAFSLFRHRAKAHNLEHNYTTHTCDQCDKIFFSISELNLHKQRHSSEKDYECPECKKLFTAKGNLRIHMRTHAKEKLYKCDICDNSFSHPYSLVSHRRIHTNEFPYKCPECEKSYRSKHQLTSHINVHSDSRPYSCDQCSKTFRSRTAFKMHQDEHRGIKRFICKFCGRKFQCHANKAKHERRHLGVKRYKCESCDKAFIEKQELKNHQKVHEKQNSKDPKCEEAVKPAIDDKDTGECEPDSKTDQYHHPID